MMISRSNKVYSSEDKKEVAKDIMGNLRAIDDMVEDENLIVHSIRIIFEVESDYIKDEEETLELNTDFWLDVALGKC